MAFVNTKFEVSDPAFYDTLITDQKRKVRRDSNSAEKWLELGRLQEAKVEMTKCFVEKSFMLRLRNQLCYRRRYWRSCTRASRRSTDALSESTSIRSVRSKVITARKR